MIATKYTACTAVMLLSSIFPSFAHALMSSEIRSEDVFLSGYCKFLAETSGDVFEDTVSVDDLKDILYFSNDLIEGGDNLDFVSRGAGAAQAELERLRDRQSQSDVGNIDVRAKISGLIRDCAIQLESVVSKYRENSCGYGTNRKSEGLFQLEPR